MSELISVDAGEVTTVTVDRPDTMNALTTGTVNALRDAIRDAEDRETRVLVITGAGDEAFIAGGDLSRMADLTPEAARTFAERGHELCGAVESFPAPVIAAINGHALGAGLELALACDLRVASERAILGEPEVELGVIPGFGGTQRLPRHVGDETARRLIFFGDRVDARDAQELGLVGDVVAHDELDAYVDELATDLAEKPSGALAAAKAALNERFESTVPEGLRAERDSFADRFGTHDQREGMTAFLEDREPEFE
ncbi:MAG: enoyl-CoA hydratase/isomerase family protein [Halobacteriales archaeon]